MIDLFADYKPHAKQKEFHRSKARFKDIAAGARAGKTYGCGKEFIKRVSHDMDAADKGKRNKYYPLFYWVVAPTSALVKIALREIASTLAGYRCLEPSVSMMFVDSWNRTEHRLILFGGRVIVWFKSADRPDLLVAEGLDGLWIDEAARMKADAWRGNLRMRLSDKRGWCLFSSTPKGPNWYYTDVYKRGLKGSASYDPEWESFHFRTVDNTAVPSLIEEVNKARNELPKAYFEREYEANFDAFFGQIYEELSADIHLVDNVPRGTKFKHYVAGMDFGWDEWYVLEEIVKTHLPVASEDKSAQTWAKLLWPVLERYPDMTIWCDHADPEAIKLLQRSKLPARNAHKEVLNGIARVASMFHPRPEKGPKLKILKRCKNTWEQNVAYHWDEYNGVSLDRPAPKQNDHCADYLRYALYSDFVRNKGAGQHKVMGY
jgi:hypothetical protein